MERVTTYIVNNPKELKSLTSKLKRKAFFSMPSGDEVEFLGMHLKFKEKAGIKYSWTNRHFTVNYAGLEFDLKIPTGIGLGIISQRPKLEEKYNDGFLRKQTKEQMISHEMVKYLNLNAKGVETLTVHPDLNQYIIDDGLLTVKEKNISSVLDIIKNMDDKKDTQGLNHLTEKLYLKLNQMHDAGIFWGDAWLGNFIYSQNKLMPIDFGFNPDDINKSDEFCAIKDFMGLIYSINYRTNSLEPQEIIESAIKSYHLNNNLKNQLIKECDVTATSLGEKEFFKPVFGLDSNQINQIRKTVIDNL